MSMDLMASINFCTKKKKENHKQNPKKPITTRTIHNKLLILVWLVYGYGYTNSRRFFRANKFL